MLTKQQVKLFDKEPNDYQVKHVKKQAASSKPPQWLPYSCIEYFINYCENNQK